MMSCCVFMRTAVVSDHGMSVVSMLEYLARLCGRGRDTGRLPALGSDVG